MARDASFIFVPWELTRSLNTLGDMLLASSPRQAKESAAWAREHGIERMILTVSTENEGAIRLYHAMGYRDFDLVMLKRLDGA